MECRDSLKAAFFVVVVLLPDVFCIPLIALADSSSFLLRRREGRRSLRRQRREGRGSMTGCLTVGSTKRNTLSLASLCWAIKLLTPVYASLTPIAAAPSSFAPFLSFFFIFEKLRVLREHFSFTAAHSPFFGCCEFLFYFVDGERGPRLHSSPICHRSSCAVALIFPSSWPCSSFSSAQSPAEAIQVFPTCGGK